MRFPRHFNAPALISFLGFVIFFQIMSGAMGWITVQGIPGWYHELVKSPLNPPNQWFSIVWTVLYVLLAAIPWLIWRKPDSKARQTILWMYAGHMLLNWIWTPVFFTFHAVLPALVIIFVLIFTAAILAWLCWKKSRIAGILFVPYILWLCFAAHLTHYILMKN